MRTSPETDDRHRRLLEDALLQYRSGRQGLHEAAQRAGLEEWAFLEAAQSTPDPVGAGLDKGLKPFVRERP